MPAQTVPWLRWGRRFCQPPPNPVTWHSRTLCRSAQSRPLTRRHACLADARIDSCLACSEHVSVLAMGIIKGEMVFAFLPCASLVVSKL